MLKTLTTTLIATTMLSGAALAESNLTVSSETDASVKEDTSIKENVSAAMHDVKDAVAGTSISKLADKGEVTVSGKVTAIDTVDNEFTLTDDTGEIDVEMEQDLSVAVGDKVTVTGTITEDIGEKEIAAKKVTKASSSM